MSQELWHRTDEGAIELNVQVQPAAGRTAILGRHGNALKVRVAAPPERGKANESVRKLLATSFGVGESAVALVAGETSRSKRFRLTGVDAVDFGERLDDLLAEGAGEQGPGPRGHRR
jgi:uncharacterized protein (TIGR00251 family)